MTEQRLALPPPTPVPTYQRWAQEIRVRRDAESTYTVFVPSAMRDQGMTHYGLTREQAVKYVLDYLDELVAR